MHEGFVICHSRLCARRMNVAAHHRDPDTTLFLAPTSLIAADSGFAREMTAKTLNPGARVTHKDVLIVLVLKKCMI